MLSARHQIFADAILRGASQTDAALEAGYAESTAANQGHRLTRNDEIRAYIAERREHAAERAELSIEWVVQSLREVAERCMQAVPVRDKDGEPTGEWVFRENGANQALQLIGKHLGMWPNKLTVTHEDAEAARIAAEQLGVDPAEVIAEVERELKEARA